MTTSSCGPIAEFVMKEPGIAIVKVGTVMNGGIVPINPTNLLGDRIPH